MTTTPNTEAEELAYVDYLGAREAAIQGAAGYFVTANVSSDILRTINHMTSNEIVGLATRMILHQRGEDWTAEK